MLCNVCQLHVISFKSWLVEWIAWVHHLWLARLITSIHLFFFFLIRDSIKYYTYLLKFYGKLTFVLFFNQFQRNDIAMAITKFDQFDFLIDIVPRDELKPPKRQVNKYVADCYEGIHCKFELTSRENLYCEFLCGCFN